MPFITNAIEGGTVMRQNLKQVLGMTTQLSVARRSGSSERNPVALTFPVVTGEGKDQARDGVFVQRVG